MFEDEDDSILLYLSFAELGVLYGESGFTLSGLDRGCLKAGRKDSASIALVCCRRDSTSLFPRDRRDLVDCLAQ